MSYPFIYANDVNDAVIQGEARALRELIQVWSETVDPTRLNAEELEQQHGQTVEDLELQYAHENESANRERRNALESAQQAFDLQIAAANLAYSEAVAAANEAFDPGPLRDGG